LLLTGDNDTGKVCFVSDATGNNRIDGDALAGEVEVMTTHTPRIEQYYNSLIGHGRHRVAPTMAEAQRDLRRVTVAETPISVL
jgi:hypothetical protein